MRSVRLTYHKVDGRSTPKDMRAWHNSPAPIEPFRRTRVVEGSSLAIQLHVLGVDTRAEDPWVVEVVFSGLNQEDLEIVVKIGQSSSDYTSA
jgi:hypothetical protein